MTQVFSYGLALNSSVNVVGHANRPKGMRLVQVGNRAKNHCLKAGLGPQLGSRLARCHSTAEIVLAKNPASPMRS